MSVVKRVGSNPHCSSGNRPLASQESFKSPGSPSKKRLTHVGYEERDAAVVSALHVENSNDRVVPLLWDFSLAPDENGKSAKLQEDGPALLNSDFQQFHG